MPANHSDRRALQCCFLLVCVGRLCFSNFYHNGHNVDELASALTFCEGYSAVDEGIESVVFAHAYILSGVVNCAALTFDDVACFSILTTEYFDAESFAL